MSDLIQDGTGQSYFAKVSDNNKLWTYATSDPADRYANIYNKKVWTAYFQTTPTGAGDYFFYLKNNGTKLLAITDIRIISANANKIITYEYVTGTPTYDTDTDITVTNRNTTSKLIPTATIKKDVDITGLSSDGVVYMQGIETANKMFHLSASANFIVGIGGAVAFKDSVGTGQITCMVSLVELEIDS